MVFRHCAGAGMTDWTFQSPMMADYMEQPDTGFQRFGSRDFAVPRFSPAINIISPSTYLTSDFKIKFHVVGFNISNQYVNIDDIRINALNPDTGITFKINNGSGDKIVYLDSNGNPATSTNPANKVISSDTQVILTYSLWREQSGCSPDSPSPVAGMLLHW